MNEKRFLRIMIYAFIVSASGLFLIPLQFQAALAILQIDPSNDFLGDIVVAAAYINYYTPGVFLIYNLALVGVILYAAAVKKDWFKEPQPELKIWRFTLRKGDPMLDG